MADDQGKGAGKQALAPDVLAARAAEQRERDAEAFAEREYDLARQAAGANADGNGYRLGRGFGRGFYGPPPPQPRLEVGVTDFAPPAPQSATDTANAFTAATQAMKAVRSGSRDRVTAGGSCSGSQICPRKIVATASIAVRSSG